MSQESAEAVTAADVEAAARAIAGAVLHTPTVHAPALSDMTGCELWLKLENLQDTGSFKVRGALNRLLALSDEQRRAGVITMSAGNHAQGVARHARGLGIPATIVMPRPTPFTKVERTEALGGKVVLEGETLAEAARHAHALAEREGLAFVHPFDDARVIAGQGTVGLEMLADAPGLDTLVVPIGGGGLISGIALAAKARNPDIEVIGVQAEANPSMHAALGGAESGAPGPTLAEGIAVKTPGRLTLPIVRRLVSEVLLVGEAAIECAVNLLVDRQKIVAEGAAAAALAAVQRYPERFAGRRVGIVISGGNIDQRLLASILMRGLSRAGRMARLRIEINDAPGALARTAGIIAQGGGNIIEIFHQRLFMDVPVKMAEVDVLVETTDSGHIEDIVAALNAAGSPTRVLRSTAEAE